MSADVVIKNYVEHDFRHHLAGLSYHKPNRVIRSHAHDFGVDEQTMFFGGRNWERYERDISRIPTSQKELFIIALFSIVVIDLNMHAHFRPHYPLFRSKTMYPKFGWPGFCCHFEKPKKLLRIPVEHDHLTFSQFDEYSEQYANYFFESFEQFFKLHAIPVTSEEFFQAMLTDRDFRVQEQDKGTVFEKIYFSLYNRLTKGK